MLLINTRPADRAAALSACLRAAGIDVLELPLLELTAAPWSQQLAQQFQTLPAAQVIVAVSPSAVQYGMQGLERAGINLQDLAHLRWIAVGEATAQALRQHGVQCDVPEVETSEGMLRLPVLQQLPAQAAVAFWRGEGGRQFMMDSLLAQGNQVLNFVLYRRGCPAQAAQILHGHLTALQREPLYAVLISSEASWNYWLELTAAHPALRQRAAFLVLGERVEALINAYCRQQQGCRAVLLTDLKAGTILEQLNAMQGNT